MDSLNVVFTAKDTVEVRLEAVPELKAGQILVQSQRSLISSGTECICLQRNFAEGTHWHDWVKYPFRPGYCNAGRVLEIGAGAGAFKPGDRVAVRANHKQHYVCEAAAAVKIPDGVSDEDAAWFGMASIAQTGVRRAEHELGDAVAIVGLGLLGQLVTQFTRLFGAREVIAIDTSAARLKMAAAHGATQALQVSAADALEPVRQLTDGRLADVVYDITGFYAVFPSALRLARNFGKLLLLGDSGNPSEQRLTPDVIRRGLRIIGAHDNHSPAAASDYVHWTKANMAALFFTYLQRGQMRVSGLVTHRYSPQQAPEAYKMLTTDRSGAMGVIFDWTKV